MTTTIVAARAARQRHRAGLRSLAADDRGSAGIEFALVVPLLLGLLLGSVTLFDLYRYAERTEATTYTIADLLSRQDLVDRETLDDLHATHAALIGGDPKMVSTRMSSVVKKVTKRDKKNQPTKIELVVQWTYDSDKVGECKPAKDLPLDLVPDIAVNDSVLIVETASKKWAMTDRIDGELERSFSDYAIVRPRYRTAVALRSAC